jgi:Spherulation-specific family 4
LLRINLVYYGRHTPEIDSRIIGAQPQYVIVNTPHGLWGEIYGNDIMQNIPAYKRAGIKVIGYLTAGYEGKGSAGKIEAKWSALETNVELIKNMAEIDKVDGVFIDECTSFPGVKAKDYLTTLTNIAHKYGLLAWGNPGEAKFDAWYFGAGGFDLMQSNENWRGQKLSPVQREWGSRISVTGNNPKLTAEDAFKLTVNAREKGLGYCYISNSGYTVLPSWLEEYTALLSKNDLFA